MKNVVITGSNGFVGSRLTTFLIEHSDFNPIALVRNGSNISLLPNNANITFVNYHSEEFDNIIDNADIIIHTAGLTKAMNWDSFEKVNIGLTRKIVSLCNRSNKIKQFIFISSQAAAGPSDSNPLTEESPCNPVSQYGKSKKMAEDYIEKNCMIPWTIVRPVSVFGPGDKDFLVYFSLIRKHISVYVGTKDKFLNLIYVDDLVNLIIKTIENENAYNEIFFASSNKQYSLEQFVQFLEEIMESFSIPIIIPIGLLKFIAFFSEIIGKIKHKTPILNREKVKEFKEKYWLVDNSKAENKLNFKEQSSLFDGLYKTFRWYKNKDWIR